MSYLQTSERSSAAAITALSEDIPHDALDDLGEGLYNRRLTDKILAAFNHAYATGAFEVASILRSALAKSVGQPPELESDTGERRSSGALGQADLWVRYVNARNAFRAATDPESGAGSATVDMALDRMKDAYRRWSAG
jgi:hypothetical protein